MGFVVRRVGGGTFNPRAMCFSPDERFLFVGCGVLVNIYALPNFTLVDQRAVHQDEITSIVCSEIGVVSGDRKGVILFFKYNEMTIIEKTPYDTRVPMELRTVLIFEFLFDSKMFGIV